VREKSISLGGGKETGRKNDEKSRRPSRLLAVFKAVVLLALAAVCAYGMLYHGLYSEEFWLPVAAGVLALILVTLFVRGYYQEVSQAAWVMVAFLAVLVGVKGLSMMWTMSQTETINEVLRSSMYLAVFLAALGALTSGRQVGPLMDIAILMITALAGYGFLQKINPAEYPVTSLDGVRIDSTLGYGNSVAVLLAMGMVLALARTTAMRNPLLRGLYAVLLLGSLVTLYLTLSRGGIGSFGLGLGVLLVLGTSRLQMLANLLLVSLPGAWLWSQIRPLGALLSPDAPMQQKVAQGLLFRNDLVIALVVAFVLQVAYAFFVSRYELTSTARRYVVWAVGLCAAAAAAAFALFIVTGFGGAGAAVRGIFSNPEQGGNAAQRLFSLGVGFRADYWKVAWEAWLQSPLTGTGAGTFQYTWLEERSGVQGVKQVHNLYLEQLTETGIFAFLALAAFALLLVFLVARAAWHHERDGEGRLLLSGLAAAIVVYLVSSVVEWHWYLPGATLFFFILAAGAARMAGSGDHPPKAAADETNPG
jgi:hypothetical protein